MEKRIRQFTESPNSFYIGVTVDPDSGDVQPAKPAYLSPQALTSHAVILGMTGSGKTGLGVTILEEATIDDIPQLIIDPKGDLTNLLLAFPEFEGEHFEQWLSPDDIPEDETIAGHAQKTAQEWQEKLQTWGIDIDRVERFRRSAQFSIYTPGSEAGLPLSIFSSFNAPSEGWEGNEEMLRERIGRLVSALLRLIGAGGGDYEDPEHILLSNLFEYNWRNNVDVTVEKLIMQVQQPPFSRLGALEIDTVISDKKRYNLGRELNNLLAAPHFRAWTEGESMNVSGLLTTGEGYPRTSIIYTAHLNEEQKAFITTTILESVMAWMRAQSGTNSLRALLYIDEVYGLLPPHPRNPPTKEPLMRLLKQGRAYGLGLVLTSQNPVDIDYKALTNVGTWFMGKLQTANDRRRVLEGLSEANDATNALNPDQVEDLLGDLEQREFIKHSIHDEDTPFLLRVRQTMSYLRGPLNREQVTRLMAGQREERAEKRSQRVENITGLRQSADSVGHSGTRVKPREQTKAQEPTYSGQKYTMRDTTLDDAPPGFLPARPTLPSSVDEYFLPAELTLEYALKAWRTAAGEQVQQTSEESALVYRPTLLAQATVNFKHNRSNSSERLWYAFSVPDLPEMAYLEWDQYQTWPFDPQTLNTEAAGAAFYADIPPALESGSGFRELRDSLTDWLYTNLSLSVLHNRTMNIFSRLGEERSAFMERVRGLAKEERDSELDDVAEKYDRKLERLERQIQKKESRIDAEKEERTGRQREEVATAGESIIRLLRGRIYRTVARVAEHRRQTSQSDERVEVLQEDLQTLEDDAEEMVEEMEHAFAEVDRKWRAASKDIEQVPVTPNKTDITVVFYGVGWVPYWAQRINGRLLSLPATPSALADAQLDIYGYELTTAGELM